jgi:hypothetical protein
VAGTSKQGWTLEWRCATPATQQNLTIPTKRHPDRHFPSRDSTVPGSCMLRDARHCGEHITNRQFVFVSVLALAKFFLCKSTLRSFGNPICPSCRCLGIGNQPLHMAISELRSWNSLASAADGKVYLFIHTKNCGGGGGGAVSRLGAYRDYHYRKPGRCQHPLQSG